MQVSRLSVCPQVTVTVPDRPPHRARGGHDPVIYAYERVLVRCSRVQSPHVFQVQRVLLLTILGC
jgi:hypothetical protein